MLSVAKSVPLLQITGVLVTEKGKERKIIKCFTKKDRELRIWHNLFCTAELELLLMCQQIVSP